MSQAKIKELLAKHPAGLTAKAIMEELGISNAHTHLLKLKRNKEVSSKPSKYDRAYVYRLIPSK